MATRAVRHVGDTSIATEERAAMPCVRATPPGIPAASPVVHVALTRRRRRHRWCAPLRWDVRDATGESAASLGCTLRDCARHHIWHVASVLCTKFTVFVAKAELDSGLRTSALAFCQCKIYQLRRRQLAILGRITYFLASFRRYCSKNEQ